MSRCNATLWSLQCPTAIITTISVDRSAFECGFPIPTVVCTHYSCSVPTWSQFDLYFVQIVQKVVVVIIIIIPFVTVGISLFCCLIEDKNNDNYAECTRSMHKHAVWPVSPYLSKYYVLQTQCIQRQTVQRHIIQCKKKKRVTTTCSCPSPSPGRRNCILGISFPLQCKQWLFPFLSALWPNLGGNLPWTI